MGMTAQESKKATFIHHGINAPCITTMTNSPISKGSRECHQARVVAQLGSPQRVSTRLPENDDDLIRCKLLLLQLDSPSDSLCATIESAERCGITVILTPAPSSTTRDAALACRGDFLIANQTELEALTGLPVGSFIQMEEATRCLLQRGLNNVIITLGERGCLWMSHGKTRHVAAYKVQEVDTRGAGDAFIGCFAHYYAKDGDVMNALEHASLYAACSVTHKGIRRSYPSLAKFQAFRP